MSNLSKSACFLSIQHLFRNSDWCHLWTFTFPDDVPPIEAARRWRLFVRWLVETGKVCVRVLESGTVGGRWHYHCVTPDRWNVNDIREASGRYEFGRINVKKIPASSARYVAKYLNKDSRGHLPKGQRRWACVGFDGVPVNRIKSSSDTRFIPAQSAGRAYTHVEWTVAGYEPVRKQIRVIREPKPAEIQRIHVSNAQWEAYFAHLNAGKPVVLGEYRGLTVTQKVVKDDVTRTRIESGYLEHRIESCGNTIHVREWLTPGTDLAAIALPANVGDVVVACLESVKTHKGTQYLVGVVKPLVGVGESRNQSVLAL